LQDVESGGILIRRVFRH